MRSPWVALHALSKISQQKKNASAAVRVMGLTFMFPGLEELTPDSSWPERFIVVDCGARPGAVGGAAYRGGGGDKGCTAVHSGPPAPRSLRSARGQGGRKGQVAPGRGTARLTR